MGDAPLNAPVTLLLLQHLLFPEWAITRDRHGIWRATGRVTISAPDVDGLLDVIRITDPGTVERAVRLLGGA
ncbi:hypothetical protein [Actinomadura sp. 7K507]|uniref:hypothetical protein n=1 Tax=Actinomadura sp. 7K507 TaxID=2530365 RepID=UPI0010458195|nr:hypothetical protein [Actinomadura sp. 7K507]TDC98467.1 hypothetical protein E1285_00655 [Actinomadura sp. 7K507]